MDFVAFIETIFQNPPIPYEPARHSLKAWVKYCLQNRGFKVVYAQSADFAIEMKGGDKYQVKVTDTAPEAPDTKFTWFVVNPDQGTIQVWLPDSA